MPVHLEGSQMFGMSIFTLAFVVWLIIYALHYFKSEEPGATACLVMMVCSGIMTVGNVLGLLMGSLISGLLLVLTIPMTKRYYDEWQAKKRGW